MKVIIEKLRLYKNLILVNVSIFYLVGIILHILPATRGLMRFLTPFTLFGIGGITLAVGGYFKNSSFNIWIGLCFFLTLLLEIIGVLTGLVFGAYAYGDVLGLKLFEVPLVIGFNWVLVIFGFLCLVQHFIKNFFLGSLLVALFAFVFDFLMEPVAIELGYWIWAGGDIPLQNYIAWFLIAFIFSLSYYLYVRPEKSELNYFPIIYLGLQLVFFAVLRVYFSVL